MPDGGHGKKAETAPPRAPGMKYRHYAPKAPMTLLLGSERGIATYVLEQCANAHGLRVGVLVTEETEAVLRHNIGNDAMSFDLVTLGRRAAPETIAHNLYASLRCFDAMGVDVIYAEGPLQDGIGVAILDRMRKAAEGRVVYIAE